MVREKRAGKITIKELQRINSGIVLEIATNKYKLMIKILAVQKTGRAKTQKLLKMLVSSGRLARRGVLAPKKVKTLKKRREKSVSQFKISKLKQILKEEYNIAGHSTP